MHAADEIRRTLIRKCADAPRSDQRWHAAHQDMMAYSTSDAPRFCQDA